MSIVKMKKVKLISHSGDRDRLLNGLLKLGCVELRKPPDAVSEEWLAITSRDIADDSDLREELARYTAALSVLDRYAPKKSKLFAQPAPVSPEEFFSEDHGEISLKADKLNAVDDRINGMYSEQSKLKNLRVAMTPWSELTLPLESQSTDSTALMFGTVPASVGEEELFAAADETGAAYDITLINENAELKYLQVFCYKKDLELLDPALRAFGFAEADFKEFTGSARDNLAVIEAEIQRLDTEIEVTRAGVSEYSDCRSEFKLMLDRITQHIAQQAARNNLILTDSAFYFEGWVPAEEADNLDSFLGGFEACSWEYFDPVEEEYPDVPVKLKNSSMISSLNMVTEMYSLPAYNGIDPNPLIAPWFCAFFGIMYADMGYGLILLALGFIGRKKIKRGTMRYATGLLILCGITTFVFGFIFGSFFGDSIPTFLNLIGSNIEFNIGFFDPLGNPMIMLIATIAIGFVQIMVGMGIKVYMLIRDGKALDALFDVGSWWLVFAGIAVGVLGHGWWVLIAGAAALVLTQGRHKPTIIGKLTSGLGSLYDITGYFGDVLSYTRLMALLMAGSVIGTVFNTLGAMTGSIITFFIIFLAGHAFNMGINIIGTFVHAARLQYLEFFGKFYEDGGRPFKPLAINTRHTEIIKEEI